MTTSTQVLKAFQGHLGRLRVLELAEATRLTTAQVTTACRTLVKRGLLARPWRGTYRPTAKGAQAIAEGRQVKSGPKGPHAGETETSCLRSRLWKALRIVRKGSPRELLELASRGETSGLRDAQAYLGALAAAGYLRRMSLKAEPISGSTVGATRFLLIRDTGPKAPRWNKRQHRLHDVNTGETHDLP